MAIEQPQHPRQHNGKPPVRSRHNESATSGDLGDNPSTVEQPADSDSGISPVVIVVLKVALGVFIAMSVAAQVWALPLVARRSVTNFRR